MFLLFLTVFLVHAAALAVPGPDFFFVSQTAASRSRREAVSGAAGVTLGVMVWSALALTGLHAVLQKYTALHTVISFAGGLYLLWMGWSLLRPLFLPRDVGVPVSGSPAVALASKTYFLKGLFTNLANPKALVYFGSLFSAFVGSRTGWFERQVIFWIMAVETLVWFTGVAVFFGSAAIREKYRRLSVVTDTAAGVLFTGFGMYLLFSM